MLRETIYSDRNDLDDFLLLSPSATLNTSIYKVLLTLREPQPECHRLQRLKFSSLEIFNEAYYQCTKLQIDRHPEEDFLSIYFDDALDNLGCNAAAEITFSIVFVLLSVMANKTVKTENFVHIIYKHLSSSAYFSLFAPIADEFKVKDLYCHISFKPSPIDISAPNKLDWAKITHDFSSEKVYEAILLANNEEGQHEILDAIESQFKQTHPYNDMEPIDAAIEALRANIVNRFYDKSPANTKQNSVALNHAIISQIKEAEDALNELKQKYEEVLKENIALKKNQFNFSRLLKVARDHRSNNFYQIVDYFTTDLDNPNDRVKAEKALADGSIPSGEPFVSDIYLNPNTGYKINFLRISNCAWALNFFVDANGNAITKTKLFYGLGKLVNVDLSNWSADLSEGRARTDRECRSELAIFNKLIEKQKEINKMQS